MEAHLRKITRCLGKAVEKLEGVSTSEKAASEVDPEWIARFHADIALPAPPPALDKNDSQWTTTRGDEAGGDEADLRWKILELKWLPLLRDLQLTISALDREEREAQEVEKESGLKERQGGSPVPRPPKGLLSLRDYTVIHAALEVVVHWGLAPVLEPGVGVFDFNKRPRSRAVKISRRVLQYWKNQGQRPSPCGPSRLPDPTASNYGSLVSGDDCLGAVRVRAQIAQCVEVIQGVVMTEQFLPMFLQLYLPDLLASRLQLVYGRGAALPPRGASADDRRCRPRDRSIPSIGTLGVGGGGTTVESFPPSSAASDGFHVARQSLEEGLKTLLSDLGPRQIMGALRQLLSEGTRAPPWLRNHGGRMLSVIVLRPGGVQATLEVYLAGAWTARDGVGAGSREWVEGDGLKACQRLAKLLATPPKRVRPAEYVSRVAPQLAEMLHYGGEQRAIVTRVVVMIVGRLSESMPRETRRVVLAPLLRPLLLFWGPDREGRPPTPSARSTADATPTTKAAKIERGDIEGEGVIASKEEALGQCLEDLEKLLTASPAPPALLRLLSNAGVAVPLFRMHCFCKRAKSRDLQSTKACLTALLSSCESAAADLVASLLPARARWGDSRVVFAAGPAGGTILRVCGGSNVGDVAAPTRSGVNENETVDVNGHPGASGAAPIEAKLRRDRERSETGLKSARADGPSSGMSPPAHRLDDSLLGLEASLQGLGLNPETLKLMTSSPGIGLGNKGSSVGLVGALSALKEAEERAQDAAQILEGLGEGSPVAGKVFDILLRRYLAVRYGRASSSMSTTGENAAAGDGTTMVALGNARSTDRTGRSVPETTSAAAADAGEEHAVMVAVVVLAERLGALVFGTGAQVLSCIRLVLEHERPGGQDEGDFLTDGGGGSGSSREMMSNRCVDAAARVAQTEAATVRREASTLACSGMSLDLELTARDDKEEEADDTLCSVVLGLLTTLLELGEESRADEEEKELRAMLVPLKALAAGHPNAEVAEMSAMLCASILSRDLTPEQRRETRETRERLKCGSDGHDDTKGMEKRTARMFSALDAAEADLRSEAVPMRARGVVTLTRLLRTSLEGRGKISEINDKGGGLARVDMDTAVLERLLDTYARMTADADSYVYLAAVQGLAALADALPGWCIPRLVGLFVASPPGGAKKDRPPPAMTASEGADLSLSQRLKIGEAVVLSARRCGDVMPKYAHFFVNAFVVAARERTAYDRTGAGKVKHTHFSATRGRSFSFSSSPCGVAAPDREELEGHSSAAATKFNQEQDGRKGYSGRAGCDSGSDGSVDRGVREEGFTEVSLESRERYHFRASCLSNLAEVCQLLRWSLGRFSQDIVDLGVGILLMETSRSEEATLVRRGATFLLSQLLRGAGGDVLEIVPARLLRAAYRALKLTVGRDRDEATRSHARIGLSYLDVAIRGQLFQGNRSGEGGGSDNDRATDAATVVTAEVDSPPLSHHPGITVL